MSSMSIRTIIIQIDDAVRKFWLKLGIPLLIGLVSTFLVCAADDKDPDFFGRFFILGLAAIVSYVAGAFTQSLNHTFGRPTCRACGRTLKCPDHPEESIRRELP